MIEFLSDPHVWASLLTLTALEIVLGIDNLIFLSIVSGRLPQHQQRLARQIGLALALLGRIALLFSLTWIIGLTEPLLTLAGFELSWRDIVLSGGGLFLLVKGTMETHHMLEGHEEGASVSLVAEERTVKGSYIGTCVPVRDLPRFIELYRRGRLPVDRLLSERAHWARRDQRRLRSPARGHAPHAVSSRSECIRPTWMPCSTALPRAATALAGERRPSSLSMTQSAGSAELARIHLSGSCQSLFR